MSTTLIPEIQAIVDSAEERELWITGRLFEHAPYFHAGKGGDTRLAEALRMCLDDKITPQSDGSYQVHGSGGRVYRVAESCSCPASQHAKSRWCKHAVGVAVYIEWQRRIRPQAPVVLGTLRAGTAPLPSDPDEDDALGNGFPVDDETLPLALGPTSVDERLAQAAVRITVDGVDVPPMPQEDRMPADEYIPEPDTDHGTTAVIDEPESTPPAPVKIPREFTVNIKGKVHVLYTGLVVAARASGLMTLAADWTYNDAELSLAHAVCTFADGRRYEESGDATPANVSKGIATHFRRVALTRAKARCLRDALGISECSVEEMEDDGGKRETPDMTQPLSEQDLKTRIWHRIKVLSPDVARDEVGRWVHEQTTLALVPKNYQKILEQLERK